MSSKVKELLDLIKPIGELYNRIVILGVKNKRKEAFLDVDIRNHERMDKFGEENEIYGVNVALKEDDTWIEFVYYKGKFEPFQIADEKQTYSGKRAKHKFSEMLNRARILKTEPEELPSKIEFKDEINLAEITNKLGRLFSGARELLEELIKYSAISPDGQFIHLYSTDGYTAKLYRSGLVERISKGRNFYRLRRVDLAKKLLAEFYG